MYILHVSLSLSLYIYIYIYNWLIAVTIKRQESHFYWCSSLIKPYTFLQKSVLLRWNFFVYKQY